MYNLLRLRETFLIQATTPDEVETGVSKIRAAYPYKDFYSFTTYKQSNTETIVSVWHKYTLNN